MAMIRMGDTAYDIPDAVAPGVQQHLDNQKATQTELEGQIADSATTIETLEAKVDAGAEANTQLTADLADAKTAVPDVEAVLAFRGAVAKIDAKYDCVGKSDADVMRDIVGANVADGVDLAGKSEAYIQARFDILAEADVADGGTEDEMTKAFREAGVKDADIADAVGESGKARADKVARSKDAWKPKA